MPNKLSQFWQELRRRKVTRVITIYIAAAFMALELVDILSDPFGFPELTLKVAFFILIAGLILSIIISWIYDIHPEGGIVKTEAANEVSEKALPPSSKGWKIASFVSFMVIIALILLNVIPSSNKSEIFEKSIVILPFRNDSPNQNDEHIISGTMVSILDNLSKIKDLRVVPRTSSEKYRNSFETIPEITSDLGVSFALVGSMQKYGNLIRINLQLINRDDRQLWSEEYMREITQAEQFYTLFSDIAQLVASEIDAVITPEEKANIEKIPTTNLSAYDFYQRGRQELWKFREDNRGALDVAKTYFNTALEYDSTFPEAYYGLAMVYYHKDRWRAYSLENYLDSAIMFADKALSFDNKLTAAYSVRGICKYSKGQSKQAFKDFNTAIELNPNDYSVYLYQGQLIIYEDLLKAIKLFHKAASLMSGSELTLALEALSSAYLNAGFLEKARFYSEEAFKLDGDSTRYLLHLAEMANYSSNRMQAIELFKLCYQLDTTQTEILNSLANQYLYMGEINEAKEYFDRYLEALGTTDELFLNNMNRLGYIYWQFGDKSKGDYYFDEQLKTSHRINALGHIWSELKFSNYDLAGIYAFRGEVQNAYKNLRIFNQRQMMPFWMVRLINDDPLFNSIRDDPEFQQIVHDVESKYQAEHERVRQWMEENEML